MAKQTPRVEIITESWEQGILSLNALLDALSTEIITANATYANTGNTTFLRNSQLYGTFGANNFVVTNGIRGGNINGSFADLNVSTNVAIANSTAAIRLSVSNGTVLTSLDHDSLNVGNATSNTFISTNTITIQTGSTVNTEITPTSFRIANSTAQANITPISFQTGLFLANTTQIAVGANATMNVTAIQVNGGTFNSYINSLALFTGNSTVNTTVNATTIEISNSTYDATLSPNRLILGNTTANSLANSTVFKVDSATSNTVLNHNSLTIANSTVQLVITSNNVLGTLNFANAINFASTIDVDGPATFNANTTLGDGASDRINLNGRIVGDIIAASGNTTALGNTTTRFNLSANVVTVSNTLSVTRAGTFSNTIAVTGAGTFSNTIAVTGAGTFSNTINVTGVATLSNNVIVGGSTTINDDYQIIVEANGDIGAPTGTPTRIYRFPKATYSSGKFQVQIKNTGNTQISELVLAHDGTNAYVTTYGTVASPIAANGAVSPLGTYSANVNGANVELLFSQTNPNSSTKVVAHLIK